MKFLFLDGLALLRFYSVYGLGCYVNYIIPEMMLNNVFKVNQQ